MHDLTNGLKAKLIINKNLDLTVDVFGAKGDGITDDTQAIQKCISFCKTNKTVLQASAGRTYLISSSLDISSLDVNFNHSTIITNDAINIFYIESWEKGHKIEKIIVDCNNVASCGIYIQAAVTSEFCNITVKNFTTKGIVINTGYEMCFNYVFMDNGLGEEALGFDINRADNIFSNIIMRSVTNCFKMTKSGNIFNNIHCWIGENGDFDNSKMFIIDLDSTENSIMFSNIIIDSIRYGFYFANEIKAVLKISQLQTIYSPDYGTSGTVCYAFYYQTDEQIENTSITQAQFRGSSVFVINLCNFNYFTGKLLQADFASNVRKVARKNYEVTVVDSRFTTLTNVISKENNVVNLNLLLSYDAGDFPNNGSIPNLFDFPDSSFIPKDPILTFVPITDSRYNYISIDTGYFYLGNNRNIAVPAGQTGTKYIHINMTYILDNN